MLRVGFRELVEKYLQTSAIHPRQIKAEALPRCRLDSRIEVSPLVGAPDDVGWTKAPGTVAPPVPVDQAKTRLVKRPEPSAVSHRDTRSFSLWSRRSFFESLLLLAVGFLVPRTTRLELHLASPEKLCHAVGMRILDAAFSQELVSLPDRGDLPLLHGLFEFCPRFGCDRPTPGGHAHLPYSSEALGDHLLCSSQTTSSIDANCTPTLGRPPSGQSRLPTSGA